MPEFPHTLDVEAVLTSPDKPFEHVHVVDRKRKRGSLMEEEISVFTDMTKAVKEVTTSIRESKTPDVHPDLYNTIMKQGDFSDEALMEAMSHLLDNKTQGVLGLLPWKMPTGCSGSGACWTSTTTRACYWLPRAWSWMAMAMTTTTTTMMYILCS